MPTTTIRRLLFVLPALLLLGAPPAAADRFPGYDALRARASKVWDSVETTPDAYVVLASKGSSFEKAAKTLATYRKATILPFAPDAPEDALESLIRAGARYVAVFVEPAAMDVNLVRRFIVLSTIMDDDPFCDFAVGFFTATDAEQVEAFVERAIRADRDGVKPYALQCSTSNISHKYGGSSFIQGMSGDSWYVTLGDMDYAKKALADLERAGFVHLGGCADPEGIWMFDDERNLHAKKHWPFDPEKVGQDPEGEMPRLVADDFRRIKLRDAVVWTHACHIGSVGRMWVEGDIVSTFGRCERVESYVVPPDRSVALAIIEAGASAYIAPLGPNFGAQANIEQAIASETGAPLGDVMRRAWHDVVMDTKGHPEAIGVYVEGKPRRWDPDEFVNHNSPHNRCLYGDPLLRPFGAHRSPATVKIETDSKEHGVALAFQVAGSGYLGRTWYGNRGRELSGRGRIYEVIEVDGAPVVATVERAEGRRASGDSFTIARSTALLERIDGKTFLHVQLVTDDPEPLREQGARVTAFVRLGND